MLVGSLMAETQSGSTRSVEALRKSVERLASGQRIINSVDDPSGMVAAEQFRFQGGTMAMAIRNAQDGIGVLRVADSALSSIMGLVEQGREIKLRHSSTIEPEASVSLSEQWQRVGHAIETASGIRYGGTALLDGSYRLDVALSADPPHNIGVVLSSPAGGFDLAGLGLGAGGTPTGLTLLTVAAFDAALGQVAIARSRIGATENRLAYASSSLLTSMDSSLGAARRLTDVDVAHELVSMTRSRILLAAAQMSTASLDGLHRYSLAALVPTAMTDPVQMGFGGQATSRVSDWGIGGQEPVRFTFREAIPRSSFPGGGLPTGLLVDTSL